MPLYRINEDAGPRYIYTEKEWKKFKEEYLAERKEKLKKDMKAAGEEVSSAGELEEELGSEVKDLWELAKIDALVEKLTEAGFEVGRSPEIDNTEGRGSANPFTAPKAAAKNATWSMCRNSWPPLRNSAAKAP